MVLIIGEWGRKKGKTTQMFYTMYHYTIKIYNTAISLTKRLNIATHNKNNKNTRTITMVSVFGVHHGSTQISSVQYKMWLPSQ